MKTKEAAMNIEEGLKKFEVQLQADGRSVHTRRQYRRHIRLFAHWARDVGLCCDVSAVTHEGGSPVLIVATGTHTARRWREESGIHELPSVVDEGLLSIPASGRLH